MVDVVWPFHPNWGTADVRESLEWKTTVNPSESAVEQRLSLRSLPRREFEYDVQIIGRERQRAQWALAEKSGGYWLHPLWIDQVVIPESLTGTTEFLFATAFREFIAGKKAILMSTNPVAYETVDIATVVSDRITLVGPTTVDWPAGTYLYPLRRAILNSFPSMSRRADRAWTGTVSFTHAEADPFSAGHATLGTYLGFPVMHYAPNEIEDLSSILARAGEVVDTEFAFPSFYDSAGKSLRAQMHSFFARGLTEQAEFRSFLYTMQGKWKSFWIPTFADDFTLSQDALAASPTIDVVNAGFTTTVGAGADNLRDIRIVMYDGSTILRRITTCVELSEDEERLTLNAALGADITVATVKRIELMMLGRLDVDRIEIAHHADKMGVATASFLLKGHASGRLITPWEPPPIIAIPAEPSDPPVPVGTPGTRARVYESTPFNEQYAAGIYPLNIDGTTYPETDTNIIFATGAVLENEGTGTAGGAMVLFLELFLVDDSGDPLPAREQPTSWSVQPILCTTYGPVDSNTFDIMKGGRPRNGRYAGIRLEYPVTTPLVDTLICRGRQPDGTLHTLVFTYEVPAVASRTLMLVGSGLTMGRSLDDGDSWEDVTPGFATGNGFRSAVADGTKWFVGGFQTVYRSLDNGAAGTWQAVAVPDPAVTRDVRLIKLRPGRLMAYYTVDNPCRVWISDDDATTWTLAHTFSELTLGWASNGNGTAVGISDVHSTYKYYRTVDGGDSWAEYTRNNGLSSPGQISYAGGKFISGFVSKSLEFSTDGSDGSWTVKDHTGLYTGRTDRFVFDGTYYWGNAPDSVYVFRTADLTVDPTIPASGDRRPAGLSGIVAVGDRILFGEVVNSAAPVFKGLYKNPSVGALTFDSISLPSAFDFNSIRDIASNQ